MPSGAKKRKAAKKKKEKEANIDPSTNNNPQGNDDLKSQDDKGSDGGEGNSPAYHDHDDHHHPFNEGSEGVEEGETSAAQPSIPEIKSMEEVPSDITSAEVVGLQEDTAVKIEWDLKSEEDSSDRLNHSVEHIESAAKESGYVNGNFSGTSTVESINENKSKDDPYNSILEARTSEDLSNSTYPSLIKISSSADNAPVEETDNLVAETSVDSVEAAASVSEVKSSDNERSLLEQSVVSQEAVTDLATDNLVVETSVDSVKAAASVSEVKSSDNGGALLQQSVVSQEAATDLAMKKNEDKVYPLPDQHVGTPNLEESKEKECDSKVSASLSDSPVTEPKAGEHIKESETPECSENRPWVASASRMVQKTSWFSCCGLFEVLSGSDR